MGVIFVFALLPSRYTPQAAGSRQPVSVQILVLGDIGRSPRMQYHAISVAKHGGHVDLIGYNESSLHPDLSNSANVRVRALAPPPAALRTKSLPFLVTGPLKVLWQVGTLIWMLAYQAPAAKWLLVQNPPSIPTLAIAMLVSILRNTQLVIDWHNYGWTILAGTKGPNHPFVEISKVYECVMGQVAPTVNITVTAAMAAQLKEEPYKVTAPIVTLHDRPAAIFKPVKAPSERRAFLERLPETKDVAASIMSGHMKLLVSSTSWTPDEDFSLFLDALVRYAEMEAEHPILAIITGRGPQKAHYEEQIKLLQTQGKLPNIQILTAWLSMEDYAALLSCADLGICLHMSSSGVDLPMKVVDMFGAGLPVAAYSKYASFGELVKENENGCGFETSSELAAILVRLCSSSGADELRRLRIGAEKEGSLRWDEEWDRVLAPLFGLSS
ncbi:family 1 glycosyltransferase [Microdochium trichocladiopsis]|uniref:Chitobiosyldiphosphodolichol beta-mannosyltransferase n=1 Tax=Microdochium trichocladiopsis TaxID=1682393 RepID=A0A9P8YA86_9PEZI|nr:family 1 glycosyltransferase [Microdochium trichocladiopsis]KAH7031634.1 family 1 glycosyltransferase [Microdochium trichocladiopsis]